MTNNCEICGKRNRYWVDLQNFVRMVLRILLPILWLSSLTVQSQIDPEPVALGDWKAYLPYGGPRSIALSDERVFAANGLSVFSMIKSEGSYERLHKANGLSDVNATRVYYGNDQNTLAISYLNANLDFIIDGDVVNFPFIKSSNLSGNKAINHVSFMRDTAFVATAFGIVVYDIDRRQSPATYFFVDPVTGSFLNVHSTIVEEGFLYAATNDGLYRGDLSNPVLENFGSWERLTETDGLPFGACSFMTLAGEFLHVVVNEAEVYRYDGEDWLPVLSEPDWTIRYLEGSGNNLQVVLTQGDEEVPDDFMLWDLHVDGTLTELDAGTSVNAPNQMLLDSDGTHWVADLFGGVVALRGGSATTYVPNGPSSADAFDMEAFNGVLWVAPGAINASWQYTFNRNGFFLLDFGYWNNYNASQYAALDTVFDLITMTLDATTGKAYFGSFGGGVVEFDRSQNTLQVYDHTNTGAEGLQDLTTDDPGSCRIGGMQFDVNGNLWVSNYGTDRPLVVRRSDGSWKHFDCDLPNSTGNEVGQVVIDDFDQKWVQLPKGGGILVYNHGADIGNTADDQKRTLGIGAGNGNLPVPFVNCLVKDLDGEIWVGTNEGVSIFYNPGAVFETGTLGDASQPLVNLGGFNEFLLSKEIVNCMAVDGANRKWVGTNSGVFLISEDGTRQLRFFNELNSPLLSNIVLSITIDGNTGEIFFGTDKGIVSYRGDATQGLPQHTNVKVFPNPVRPEYDGPVSISGLVNNAQVKITDQAGRLIFETTALGGQAIWDGRGYSGNRASTGVYLVYSADDNGQETFVTKIVVVN
jgi:hypothetical protein